MSKVADKFHQIRLTPENYENLKRHSSTTFPPSSVAALTNAFVEQALRDFKSNGKKGSK